MFSPTFECSLSGLRSAVRMRHALMGVADPEAAAARYMRGHGITSGAHDEAGVIRRRILIVIEDIEHLAACQEPECSDAVHSSSVQPFEVGRRRLRLRTSRDRLTLTD